MVNLRALEFAGVVHVDSFPGSEEVEGAEAWLHQCCSIGKEPSRRG